MSRLRGSETFLMELIVLLACRFNFFDIFLSEEALNRIAFASHYVALYRLLHSKIR